MAIGPSILRIGVVDPVGAIDPRNMAEATTILLARQVFETPFQASSTGDAIPTLFSEKLVETPGSGGLKFSTTVRTDARFSDGSPVTPEDVVGALAQDPVFTGRATASYRDGRVHLTLFAPNTRFDLFLPGPGAAGDEGQPQGAGGASGRPQAGPAGTFPAVAVSAAVR